MKPAAITFYGHACFKITCGADSVLLDPYADDSVPGLRLPEGISASRVYCSHSHSDHNARDLITETDSMSDPFEAEFITVPHDDCGGAKRGYSDITVLNVHGIKAVHFGDIGRLPSEEEYEKLKGADIVMVPAGGYYTIDARQAAAIIRRLHPKLTILMHFRTDEAGYDVLAHIDEIRKVFSGLEVLKESEIIFSDEENGRIAALQPEHGSQLTHASAQAAERRLTSCRR